MSVPNRIIYPYSENHARLVAPLMHCKSATQPLEFNPPKNELAQMVGTIRELFFHSPNGICYAGTFFAASVGELDRAEYMNLEKPVSLLFLCMILRFLTVGTADEGCHHQAHFSVES